MTVTNSYSAMLKIGNLEIRPPLVLGPMAGFTTLAFRLLCHKAGAGLVVSEMISAKALQYGSTKTPPLMQTCDQERPVALQIFGGEPDSMADAARLCVEHGADIVDINMGCTVPKVRRAQSGVGLMCDAERAVDVAAAVVRAVPVPVTVKYRSGLVVGDDSYLELGRRLQDVGVAALTLHARPASAYFRGHADWTKIARLVEAVEIPVIGNGDVHTPERAAEMLGQTGCAGVMIARAALGKPWIFRQASALLAVRPTFLSGEGEPDKSVGRTADEVWETTGRERLAVALCQAQMLALATDDLSAARQMRSQMAFYTHGLPNASAVRQRCHKMRSVAELAQIVFDYLTEAQDDEV
ncbi:MAG: tRNA dihydrouridine synthase DusB [Bacteroidota bacterium]